MLFLQILHEDGGSIFFSLASVFKQTQKKAVVHPRVDAVWHKVRSHPDLLTGVWKDSHPHLQFVPKSLLPCVREKVTRLKSALMLLML